MDSNKVRGPVDSDEILRQCILRLFGLTEEDLKPVLEDSNFFIPPNFPILALPSLQPPRYTSDPSEELLEMVSENPDYSLPPNILFPALPSLRPVGYIDDPPKVIRPVPINPRKRIRMDNDEHITPDPKQPPPVVAPMRSIFEMPRVKRCIKFEEAELVRRVFPTAYHLLAFIRCYIGYYEKDPNIHKNVSQSNAGGLEEKNPKCVQPTEKQENASQPEQRPSEKINKDELLKEIHSKVLSAGGWKCYLPRMRKVLGEIYGYNSTLHQDLNHSYLPAAEDPNSPERIFLDLPPIPPVDEEPFLSPTFERLLRDGIYNSSYFD